MDIRLCAGGGSGYTTGTLAVTPGQVLTVMVGAGGTNGTLQQQATTKAAGGFSCNTGEPTAGMADKGGRSAIDTAVLTF